MSRSTAPGVGIVGDDTDDLRAITRKSRERRRSIETYVGFHAPGRPRVTLDDDVDTAQCVQPLIDSIDTRIRIPTGPFDISTDIYDPKVADRELQFALALHEAWHARYTDQYVERDVIKSVPRKYRAIFEDFANVLEDARINEAGVQAHDTTVAVRLEYLYENYVGQAPAPSEYRDGSSRQPSVDPRLSNLTWLDAVRTLIYDRGVYATGKLEYLLDDAVDDYDFDSDRDEETFEDLAETVRDHVDAIRTTADPAVAGEVKIALFETLTDALEDDPRFDKDPELSDAHTDSTRSGQGETPTADVLDENTGHGEDADALSAVVVPDPDADRDSDTDANDDASSPGGGPTTDTSEQDGDRSDTDGSGTGDTGDEAREDDGQGTDDTIGGPTQITLTQVLGGEGDDQEGDDAADKSSPDHSKDTSPKEDADSDSEGDDGPAESPDLDDVTQRPDGTLEDSDESPTQSGGSEADEAESGDESADKTDHEADEDSSGQDDAGTVHGRPPVAADSDGVPPQLDDIDADVDETSLGSDQQEIDSDSEDRNATDEDGHAQETPTQRPRNVGDPGDEHDDAGAGDDGDEHHDEDDATIETTDDDAPGSTPGDDGSDDSRSDDPAPREDLDIPEDHAESAEQATKQEERKVREWLDTINREAEMFDGGDGSAIGDLEDLLIDPLDNSSHDPDRWADIEENYHRDARQFRRHLQQERRDQPRRGVRSGSRVDTNRIHRTRTDQYDVFQQPREGGDKEYSVVLVLDRSRSMRGQEIKIAERAIGRFALALEEVGVDVCLLDMYDSEARIVSPFGESIERAEDRITTGDATGGTPLTDILTLARERVTKDHRQPFVCIVTDGKPNDEDDYTDELEQMPDHVPVLGVLVDLRGQDFGDQEQYYTESVVVETGDELGDSLDELITGIAF